MKIVLLAILAITCIFGSFGCQKTPATKVDEGKNSVLIKENLMWDTKVMFAKNVSITEGDVGEYTNKNGTTKAIFFEGEKYKGKQTTCFAYVGIPSSKMPEGGYPAIVLVHGGGGCAFYEWVEYWNGKGYVAIAPDFYAQQYGNKSYDGKGAPKNPNGGPTESGSFSSTKETFYDSWTYHSVSNIIYAHNILRQMEQVNRDKIGITGISWGSVLTCITSGVDTRFNAFAPVYGGGYIFNAPGVQGKSYYKVPEDLDSWIECFDPSSYLSYCNKPILFTMGMNETFFSVKMNALSAKLCKGNVYYSQRKDLTHYHRWKDEEGMSNIYMFMEHVLNNKPLPYKLTSASIEGNELKFSVSDYSKIRTAVLNYTSSDGKDPRDWVWLQKGIVLDNNEKSVLVPLGTKACFVQFTDGETLQFISSSEVFFINK